MKWFVSTILSMLLTVIIMPQTLGNYQNYEDVTVIDGTLLADFDDIDYQEALKTLDAQSRKDIIGYFKSSHISIIYTSHHLINDRIIKTYAL